MTPREEQLIERALAQGLLSRAEVDVASQASAAAGGLLPALAARLEPARRAQLSALWQAAQALGPWQLGAHLPGGLELTEKLGAGGMGEVFLTRDPSGAFVAVKALDRDAHPTLAERFRREGEAQARVDGHPHVLRVRSAGLHAGRAFLVMDYAGGGDLKQRLKNGPLPADEVLSLGVSLADALAHAHAQGVLHRDLKPANVLLDAEGRAQLADFGLAGIEGAETLTQTGTSLGTPGFMAPEQVDSKRGSIGPTTDVYGLGALLFHLASGRPPFTAPSRVGLITRLLTEPAPKLRSLRPDAPAALEGVLERCLHKDPVARYPTMRDLEQALREAAAGVGPQPARGRAVWAALVAVILLAAALAVGLSPRGQATPDASPSASATLDPSASATLDPSAAATPAEDRPQGLPLWSAQPEELLYRLRYDRTRHPAKNERVVVRIEAYFSLSCAPAEEALHADVTIRRLVIVFRGASVLGEQRFDTDHLDESSELRTLSQGVGSRLRGRIDPARGALTLGPETVAAFRQAVVGGMPAKNRALDPLAEQAGLPPLRALLERFMDAAFLNACLGSLTRLRGSERLDWRPKRDKHVLARRAPPPLPLLELDPAPPKGELSGELRFADGRCLSSFVEQRFEGTPRRTFRCELQLNPSDD